MRLTQPDTQSVSRLSPGVNTPGFAIIQRIRQAATDHSVTDAEFRVLTLLMLAAGPAGETTWRHRTIGDRVGKSERSVRRALDRLKDSPYLAVEHRGYQRSNRYVMPWHSHREGSNGGFRERTKEPSGDVGAELRSAESGLCGASERAAEGALRGDHRGDGAVVKGVGTGNTLPGTSDGARDAHAPVADRTESAAIKRVADQKTATHTIIEAECAALAGRKLTPADDAAVAEFIAEHGEVTRDQVRAGIAATLVRAQGRRINGVRYFFAEILRVREALPDAAGYAEHCVGRLRREMGREMGRR